MRILFLTTDLSYPPQDGRTLRTYKNVLRGLAGWHMPSTSCASTSCTGARTPDERRRVAEARLRELCASVDVFELPSKRSKAVARLDRAPRACWRSAARSRVGVYRSRAALHAARCRRSRRSQPMDVRARREHDCSATT